MALHSDRPGLSVVTTVDDEQLPEYSDDQPLANSVVFTKYIGAGTGAEYAIIYKFTKPFPTNEDIRYTTLIDGIKVENADIGRNELLHNADFVIDGIKAQRRSNWVQQSFCFADLRSGE
jgi:hypothetical protein